MERESMVIDNQILALLHRVSYYNKQDNNV